MQATNHKKIESCEQTANTAETELLHPFNQRTADRLREYGALLEHQKADHFRARAYHRAADTIAALDHDIGSVVEAEGIEGLTKLPFIGEGIAGAVVELVRTGRWGRLERLRGSLDGAQLFAVVPSIGPELAKRIHETLHIDTLEALELAAYDGRLDSVPGIGKRRVQAIRSALAEMLKRIGKPKASKALRPPLKLLLELDGEYREMVVAGTLPTIAPRRFNPAGNRWLPILHTTRDGWHFTLLFSNTALAHKLSRTSDWVIVYFVGDDHSEGQVTIVTETRGPLQGKRVIRGHESECQQYYQRRAA